jgi:hypothetical protein
MTEEEKTAAISEAPGMIRLLESMRAYEIIREAEALGLLDRLLATEETISALATQVESRKE